MQAAPPTWVVHTSADGRPYWYNSVTQLSVWEKPAELQSPVEQELAKLPWKEYETQGRKYWVHDTTKETTWVMPPEYTAVLSRTSAAAAAHNPPNGVGLSSQTPTGPAASAPLAAAPAFLPSRPNPNMAPSPHQPQQQQQQQQQYQSQPPMAHHIQTEFNTKEEAERAFMGMLVELKVTPAWTWERTMRETIVHPLYKALKTLAERKEAFGKYIIETEAAEAASRIKRLETCRKAWMTGLEKMKGGPLAPGGVKSWWSWNKASGEIEKSLPDLFKALPNDDERRTLFNEYITALKTKEMTRTRNLRTENLAKLNGLFQTLSLDLAGPLRWKDVHATLTSTPEWLQDADLQRIDPIDILAVYEEELSKAEREANEERRKVADEKRRRNRKAREAFVALLTELKLLGHITPATTWKSLAPFIESAPAYANLLGVPGSSPMELFWDILDDVERQAEDEQVAVEKWIEAKGTLVDEETTYDQFIVSLEGDDRMNSVDYTILRNVYDRLHARAVRNRKEDRRKAEKRTRIQIDDLRYAFKKLDPPVDLDATYEDIFPRIQSAPEFTIMDDDSARRLAFDKFVKRQKEKAREKEEQEAPDDADEGHEGASRKKSSRAREDQEPHESTRSSKRHRDVDGSRDEVARDDAMPGVLDYNDKSQQAQLEGATLSAQVPGVTASEAEEGEIE